MKITNKDINWGICKAFSEAVNEDKISADQFKLIQENKVLQLESWKTGALVGTGIAAVSALAYTLYKGFKNKQKQSNQPVSNEKAINNTIRALNTFKTRCSRAKDPEACKKKFDQTIAKWNLKLGK